MMKRRSGISKLYSITFTIIVISFTFCNNHLLKGQESVNIQYSEIKANASVIFEEEGCSPTFSFIKKKIEESPTGILRAKLLNLLGMYFDDCDLDSESLAYYYKALSLNDSIKNFRGLHINTYNIGHHYLYENRYQKALEYFTKSKKYALINGDSADIVAINIAIGELFTDEDNEEFFSPDSALFYFVEALESQERLGSKSEVARIYSNLGSLYLSLSNYRVSIDYYLKSFSIHENLKNDRSCAYIARSIGRAYYHQNKFDSALRYYKISQRFTNEIIDSKQLMSLLVNLTQTYMALGQEEKALPLFNQYNDLRDSLQNSQNEVLLRETEEKYEAKLKNQLLAEKEQTIQEKTFQSNLFLTLAIALMILMVTSIFFFRQKQTYLKKLKNEEIASMEQKQELKELNAMMHGQEEERNRIASDLHDRLGARLSALKLLFQNNDLQSDRTKVLHSIDEAIKETREISHNLSTDMLTRFGIVTAVDDILKQIEESDQVKTDFVHFGMKKRLPLEVERNIYHIVLELVNNTLKHAKASGILIQMNQIDNELSLFYEDDGQGMNPAQTNGNGMGLRGIFARVNSINGTAELNSKPKQGFNFVITIPLDRENLDYPLKKVV